MVFGFRLAALGAVLVVAAALSAEDKVLFQLGADTKLKVTRGKAELKESVISAKLPVVFFVTQRFKIDPAKIYTLSGEFESSAGATKDNLWFGFVPYDAKGKEIASQTYNRLVPDKLGEAAADAKKGDKTIILRGDLGKWKPFCKNSARFLAVGAKADRSDLPNYRVILTVKDGFAAREDGSFEITLAKPLPFDVAAGTLLALHTWGVSYQVVSPRKAASGTNLLSGSYAMKAEDDIKAFCPGAASVSIAFFCRDKEGELEIRNIKLVESDN